ncbi:MAG TPA: ribose-phosphate pyrophosphokinase [bacterium]|nr:ribose-phosphate pyrophosphokinase [bacterium]HPO99959.1 ribose-phosphate pyrophosphokinase [bacterium]HXK93776.1 ribose-phosphate pyrophosphokinase [bacterium]
MKVFSGLSNRPLAEEICSYMDIPLGKVEIIEFKNENLFVRIGENVRECDVFIIQTSTSPVNTRIMELLLMIDAMKHASAARVTAVLPYFPYVRSDKKDQPRISIAARLMVDLIEAAGADRVLTMNLHSFQIQGFFRIPTDHLLATPVLVDYFKNTDISNSVVVAPDAGSAKRAEKYARLLNLPLAIVDKRRIGNKDTAVVKHIIGDVKGKRAIIFDDEISTGGSLINTAETLEEQGVTDIRASVVHPVLCGDAVERIQKSNISEVIVTNTIPVEGPKKIDKIKVLSVGKMFAKAIRRIHNGESVSVLFTPFEDFK